MTSAPVPAVARRRGRACTTALLLLALAGCGGAPVVPEAATPSAAPVVRSDPGIVPAELILSGAERSAARVLPVATAPDGELAVPRDPDLLGWWVGGARVGASAGTAVVAGHVDTAEAGLGTFAALRDVEPGATVSVRAGDGTARHFRVTEIQQIDKRSLPRGLFTRSGPPRLALVTCTGEFDAAKGSYADNLIVLATPV